MQGVRARSLRELRSHMPPLLTLSRPLLMCSILTSLSCLPTVSSPHHLHQFLLLPQGTSPFPLCAHRSSLRFISLLPTFCSCHSLILSHPVTILCKAQFLGPFPICSHLPLDPSTLRLLPKLTVPGLSHIQPTAPLCLCPP